METDAANRNREFSDAAGPPQIPFVHAQGRTAWRIDQGNLPATNLITPPARLRIALRAVRLSVRAGV